MELATIREIIIFTWILLAFWAQGYCNIYHPNRGIRILELYLYICLSPVFWPAIIIGIHKKIQWIPFWKKIDDPRTF